MIPVRSRWGHIYPFFFQEKNTAAPQQHSTMPRLPKISNCNSASKAGTLEICDKTSKVTQVLILWGLWRNPRKIAEYSTLNQLFYDFLLFSSYSTYLTNFSLIFSCILPTVWTLAYFEGAPRQQKVFQGLHFDLERLDNTMILCL